MNERLIYNFNGSLSFHREKHIYHFFNLCHKCLNLLVDYTIFSTNVNLRSLLQTTPQGKKKQGPKTLLILINLMGVCDACKVS